MELTRISKDRRQLIKMPAEKHDSTSIGQHTWVQNSFTPTYCAGGFRVIELRLRI